MALVLSRNGSRPDLRPRKVLSSRKAIGRSNHAQLQQTAPAMANFTNPRLSDTRREVPSLKRVHSAASQQEQLAQYFGQQRNQRLEKQWIKRHGQQQHQHRQETNMMQLTHQHSRFTTAVAVGPEHAAPHKFSRDMFRDHFFEP
ncbi:hypothetical protein EDD11_004865 [Mortierella claussenii]|nr:hypothetical protein EDD11_004865 [Mortierella claussenii]